MAIRVPKPTKEETLKPVTITAQLEPRNNLILEVVARDETRTKRWMLNFLIEQVALSPEQKEEIDGLLAKGQTELAKKAKS